MSAAYYWYLREFAKRSAMHAKYTGFVIETEVVVFCICGYFLLDIGIFHQFYTVNRRQDVHGLWACVHNNSIHRQCTSALHLM